MRIRSFIYSGLLLLLASYGCGRPSAEVDMKEAQAALQEAKNVHADVLAPIDFQLAQKTWERAQVAAKEGKTDTARVLFVSARIYFHKSVEIANSKKDALSRELGSMQLLINDNLEKVRSALSEGDLSPKLRSQVKAIATEVEKDNATISKLVAQEDLVQAVALAKDVQIKVYSAQLALDGQLPLSN
jgi:hypothetical protein